MQLIYCFLIILILSSCGEEELVETIDMEELLPQGKDGMEIVEEKNVIAETTPLEKALMEMDNSYTVIPDSAKGSYFPDRLQFLKKELLVVQKDSLIYEVAIWEFVDSLQTINAFYNWLDCFGSHCESVKIGERKYLRDKSSKLIWVSDHYIFYVKSVQEIGSFLFWENLAKNYLMEGKWNIKLTKNSRFVMLWEFTEAI